MSPDIYAATDAQLLTQLHATQQRAAGLQRTISALPDPSTQKKALIALVRAFPQLLASAEPAEISRLLQSAGVRIYCDSGQILRIIP